MMALERAVPLLSNLRSLPIRSESCLRRYQHLDVKLVGLEKNIDDFTASAVEMAAMSNSFFKFARIETNEIPPPLNFDAVSNAFQTCGLDPIRDVDAWNVLTTRFPRDLPRL